MVSQSGEREYDDAIEITASPVPLPGSLYGHLSDEQTHNALSNSGLTFSRFIICTDTSAGLF